MKVFKILHSRATVLALAIIVEVAIVVSVLYFFREEVAVIAAALRVVSTIVALSLISKSKHLSFDIVWILGLLTFPVTVTALYLLIYSDALKSKTYKRIVDSTERSKQFFDDDDDVLEEMIDFAPDMRGQFHYIAKEAGYPFYKNRGFDYFSTGDEGYPEMIEDLKHAQHFIFIEYFIVEEGEMWNGILDILEQKAADGVDIRVMYDDLGSFTTLTANYARKLSKRGIKCIPFNRINPAFGAIMNHRDHRKIMVIDGLVAYSGGVNLADEYINVKEKYGHWKDNMIRMTGECVDSYTILFLSHWNALSKKDKEYLDFIHFGNKPMLGNTMGFDGFIAPYGESPLDDELTSQNIYMNIINQARDYCFIMTPYLIIDNEMVNALILAAKRGVDVRIMTPGIPDKKVVWKITRTFYEPLIKGGVRIYEYTPGFIHSKVFVSDDKVATVGTINLDYRSLYLHFENGTYLYGSSKINDVRDDFLRSQELSHRMTVKESSVFWAERLLLAFVKLFAPLL